LPSPKYPFPIDAARAEAGKVVFDQHCASCHASDKTGRRMPLAGTDTDKERIGTWNKSNAIEANKVVTKMGIIRKGLVEEELVGYNPPFLDGIWARAPYLHNGSVPTLRDLLEPPANRPKLFWRGYDLYDPKNVGFVAQGAEAERVGTRHDTARRANGNDGHLFGTALPAADKENLLEYLKTL
jgi:cytochrome c peroxidase